MNLEGIVVLDEGMGGWFITRNVNGPDKRFRGRPEGFCGWLAITKQRVIGYTYWKRQIHISVTDPKTAELYIAMPREDMLSVSFESSTFRKDWRGIIEFRFNTQKAPMFHDALIAIGAREGPAAKARQSCS